MPDYWLGVLTVPTIAVTIYALGLLLGGLMALFDRSPWFVEFGHSPEPFERSYGFLRTRKRGPFVVGHYEQPGWGSHWLALGPVCVGRKYRTA